MLILYFDIFKAGFESLNAIFQASVYITIVTAIVYYNSTTVRKFEKQIISSSLIIFLVNLFSS